MIPIDFAEANMVMNKPEGWRDDECMPLPVQRVVDDKGAVSYYSLWKPNKEDIEAINAGRAIVLGIVYPVHPPVYLYTLNEKGEINE